MEGRLGTALTVSFWLALVWAPLPLGSNRWWAVGVLALWVWGTLAIAVGRSLLGREGPAAFGRSAGVAWPLLAMMAGLSALPALQLLRPGGTVDAAQTQLYLLQSLIYLGGCWLAVLLCTTTERVKGTLLVLVLGALLQAVIAILLFSGDQSRYALFFFEFSQQRRASGTFPNPDHLAGYMEMGLAAGLGLMFALMSPAKGSSSGAGPTGAGPAWLQSARGLMDFVMSPKMILRLGLVVMVIALVMTHSRMGNAAFFAALLLMGAGLAVQSPRMRKPALWLVVSVLVIDVVVVGQWVGLEKVMNRLQQTDLGTQGDLSGAATAQLSLPSFSQGEETLADRLRAPRLTLKLIADHPWAGSGGGTFFTVFPPYKTPDMPWYWPHTHNDYLEVAADLGLPGLALFLMIGLFTTARLWPRLKDAAGSTERGVAVATGVALCALGLHSLVDFNLQIPSNALTLTVLVGLSWAAGTVDGRRRRKGADRAPASVLGGLQPGDPAGPHLGVEAVSDTADNRQHRAAAPEQPGME